MAVVTAKLAARAGARGVADASLGNGTRLTSGLSAVGPGWGGVVSSSPLIISSRENMVEEEPNQSLKKKKKLSKRGGGVPHVKRRARAQVGTRPSRSVNCVTCRAGQCG